VPGQLPLNVGVTGHRDLVRADRAEIDVEVRAFFADLRERCPHTPLRCYVGLAIGTDQIVAEIVLELGIELIAVVPAPVDVYLQSFVEPAEIGAFHDLLERAAARIEVPAGSWTAADFADPAKRDRQHVALGQFLADRSQILLALWDGTDNGLAGGTAWVVKRKLEGAHRTGPERIDLPESGLVYQIPVRRTSGTGEHPTDAPGYRLYPGESLSGYFAAFAELERYNARLARAGLKSPGGSLARGAEPSIDVAFAAADTVALNFQRRVLWARRALFACALVMFVSYIIYSNVLPAFGVILCYFVALLLGAGIWLRLTSARLYRSYLDCRALAEALRVQRIWSESGLRLAAVDFYLRKHHNELRWIRLGLRCFYPDAYLLETHSESAPAREASAPAAAVPDSVKADWIDAQAAYFARSERRRRRKRDRVERSATALYGLGLVCAAGSLVLAAGNDVDSFAGHTLTILMGALPGFAGIILGYAANAGWEEEANEYAHMHSVFARAERLWDTLPRDLLVAEVGKEALRNNGEWLSVHSARRLEAPKL